jgi:hypothetical protein
MSTFPTSITCIYCPRIGPFSAEHVIPAGLGGDDERFMLHGMVCKSCKTGIFSRLEAAFLVDVTGRVLAKTGINLLAYLAGIDYVRHPQFDPTRQSIVLGEPEIPLLTEEAKASFTPLFTGVPSGRHVFMIAGIPEPCGTCALVLLVKLYGSQIEAIKLGDNLPTPEIELPAFFIVDYSTHIVEQHSLLEFIRLYSPLTGPPQPMTRESQTGGTGA